MKNYGVELVLDLHNCDPTTFTRKSIRKYFKELCVLIDMERGKLTWWDDLYTPEEEKETEPHLVGTSAVQFIKTSSIVIHTLDLMGMVYLNIFSCKSFCAATAKTLTEEWFCGRAVNTQIVKRV